MSLILIPLSSGLTGARCIPKCGSLHRVWWLGECIRWSFPKPPKAFESLAFAKPINVRQNGMNKKPNADVLAALRASGDGWQTRINDTLRASLHLAGRV